MANAEDTPEKLSTDDVAPIEQDRIDFQKQCEGGHLSQELLVFISARILLAKFEGEHNIICQPGHPAWASGKELSPELIALHDPLRAASVNAKSKLSPLEKRMTYYASDSCDLMGFHVRMKKAKGPRFDCLNCCLCFDRDPRSENMLVRFRAAGNPEL